MIILACGMPKSGSGLLFNLIHDVIEIGLGLNSRALKKRIFLKHLLKTYNNSIGHPWGFKLLYLYLCSLIFGVFVVKTHGELNIYMKILAKLKLTVLFYSFRDPRDVIISLRDHGEKIKDSHPNHEFVQLIVFEDALAKVKIWSQGYYGYRECNYCHCFGYDELKTEMTNVVNTIAKELDISLTKAQVDSIADKYNPVKNNFNSKGLHFNQGVSGRYKNELTQGQINKANKLLTSELTDMGYKH